MFKRKKKEEPEAISIDEVIEVLADQEPKVLDKILELAKARRDYNRKMKDLRTTAIGGSYKHEEEEPTIDFIETEMPEKKK